MLARCSIEHAPEILAIFNEAIATSTALYDYEPRTLASMGKWFETKESGNFPVIGSFAADGSLAGFATYGTFRAFAGYKYSVEHSVYVRADKRGHGLGKILLAAIIQAAHDQDYHVLIGGIDSANHGSIHLHLQAGFSHCATIKEAGYKFGAWRDLLFYQLILPTPQVPVER
jgi:L-amino acid N-acyltransferase YncA